MKEFDRFSFPRNYSGKVPLFFRKFPEISELTTLAILLSKLCSFSISIRAKGLPPLSQWRRKQFGSGGRMQAQRASRKFFDVPPTFLLCPHMRGGQRLFVTDWETIIEVSSLVGSAVCTSTGEVGRGAIKVMRPSAVPCRLDHSVWKQSYNACPTVLYSIDQSCRTRVLDLDSSRSTRVRFLEDLDSKLPRTWTWRVRTWNWDSELLEPLWW